MNANYSHNKNKVTDLNGVESVFLAGFTGTSSRVVEGHPVGTLWGGKFARDSNGGYVLDDNGFPTISEEEGVLGDPNPDWIGGVGTVLSYKGFTLSAQLETSQGNDHWAGTEGVLKYFGIHPETANESTATADLKTFDGRTISNGTTFRGNIQDFGGGDVALDLEWYTANGGGFGNQSESFVKDASWTRLREVSLAYDLPKKLIKNAGDFSMIWTELEPMEEDNWKVKENIDADGDGFIGFIHNCVIDNYLSHHESPEDIELYFCGPPLMNQAVQKMGEDYGIPDEHIRFDDFGG